MLMQGERRKTLLADRAILRESGGCGPGMKIFSPATIDGGERRRRIEGAQGKVKGKSRLSVHAVLHNQ